MDGVDGADGDLLRRHCPRSGGHDRLADPCTEPGTPRLPADTHDTGRSTVRRSDGERLHASSVDWAGRVQLVDRVHRIPDLVGGGHGPGLSKHESRTTLPIGVSAFTPMAGTGSSRRNKPEAERGDTEHE